MGKLMVICDVQVDCSDGGVLQLPWSHTWDRTGTLQWHTCAFNVAPSPPIVPTLISNRHSQTLFLVLFLPGHSTSSSPSFGALNLFGGRDFKHTCILPSPPSTLLSPPLSPSLSPITRPRPRTHLPVSSSPKGFVGPSRSSVCSFLGGDGGSPPPPTTPLPGGGSSARILAISAARFSGDACSNEQASARSPSTMACWRACFARTSPTRSAMEIPVLEVSATLVSRLAAALLGECGGGSMERGRRVESSYGYRVTVPVS